MGTTIHIWVTVGEGVGLYMDEHTPFWQITEFSYEVSRRFQEVSGVEETIHFNTLDKWFKDLERKGIHYVQRAADKKVYDEIDLNIAVYIMKMRKEKWQLEAIMGILPKYVQLREFPDGMGTNSNIMTSEGQILVEMQRNFKKLEESLIVKFNERLEEQVRLSQKQIEAKLLNNLPTPKSAEQIRAERTDQMISATRFRLKLEEEALDEWNKLAIEERTKRVGFIIKRLEEDWVKRDRFIRTYVTKMIEEQLAE